jgi:hypothetical protein
VQKSFQQMALTGNGLCGWSKRRISLGSNHQCFVPIRRDVIIFNLNAANVTVVGSVQGIRQTQNGCELDGSFLLVGKKIAQSCVSSGGQRSAVKASDDSGTLQIHGLPSQRVAVGANQVERCLMMSLLTFGLADIVQKSGGEQAGAGGYGVYGRLPSPRKQSVIEFKG